MAGQSSVGDCRLSCVGLLVLLRAGVSVRVITTLLVEFRSVLVKAFDRTPRRKTGTAFHIFFDYRLTQSRGLQPAHGISEPCFARVARGAAAVALGCACWLMSAPPAFAGSHHYVMPDGRKYDLIESPTEVAVFLRSAEDFVAARRRMQVVGLGSLRSTEHSPNSRMKILHLAKSPVRRVKEVQNDPGVERTGRVLRFAGSQVPVVTSGTLVLKLRADLTQAQRKELWRQFKVIDVYEVPLLHDVYRVRPADSGDDEIILAERLADDPRTLWANPNLHRQTRRMQVGVQDQYFAQQWHLNNTGQLGGVPDADIDALEAWEIADGTGVLIGMFDDGCDVLHPDLSPNYIGVGQDPALPVSSPDSTNPLPKAAGDYHGTAVMGLAVAAGNSMGVRGVAFGAQFTVSRGLADDTIDELEIASTFTFALEQGVDVHNNSWGFTNSAFANPPVIVDAVTTAFREGRDPDGPAGPLEPLGMVILFASGNFDEENFSGFGLSTLPEVIGVGASTDRDERSEFSNFGRDIDILAPGGGLFSKGTATTDNEDRSGVPELGFNRGGFSENFSTGAFTIPDIDFGQPDAGNYTGTFNGTSAACPIAAGVAALVLSAHPGLTATEVRLILEHTTDKIAAEKAGYNGVTGLSLRYAHGRVNANGAVRAAVDAMTTGKTWPDHVQGARVDGVSLFFNPGVGSEDMLIVESDADFEFIPVDGACYDAGQLGCSAETLTELTVGIRLLSVGCTDGCATTVEQSAVFALDPGTRKFFGIYAMNSNGQYSFGVGIDSSGNDAGLTVGEPTAPPPAVTLSVLPLSGSSPLTVAFNGNAISELEIDRNRTAWDFDVEAGISVDATQAAASHTYTVDAGEIKTFTARLTLSDVDGNSGSAGVLIRVAGPDALVDGGDAGASDVQIVVGTTDAPGVDISEGVSPFEVLLSIDSASLDGTIQSVLWDLGDGTQANSLAVPHTYLNVSDETRTFVAVARVTFTTVGGAVLSRVADRVITVAPGAAADGSDDVILPGTTPGGAGGTASPCGTMGVVMPMMLLLTFAQLYKRRRWWF